MRRERFAFFHDGRKRQIPDRDARLGILSYIAYADCWIPKASRVEEGVRSALDLLARPVGVAETVWGPVAYRKKGILLTDSLMFVVKDSVTRGKGTDSYTLVIRGTNPGSLASWIFQDLAVSGLVPWRRRSPKSPLENAWISMATDNALEIHQSLEYRGKTVLDWLVSLLAGNKSAKIDLSITGHSLGGLMSTAFALFLREELAAAGLAHRVNFSICAFAGPTAGNGAFSAALEEAFGDGLTLYDNPLDLAPLAWDEKNLSGRMPTLYEPAIRPNGIERDGLAAFAQAVRGLGYAKPVRRVAAVPSSVVEVPFNDYLLEAIVQHVVPYAEEALREAPGHAVDVVREIVKKLLGVAQFAKFGRGRLFSNGNRRRRLRRIAKGV